MKIKMYKNFLLENKLESNKRLFENVNFLKEIYDDYKEMQDFFNDINNHLQKKVNKKEIGFGFSNDSKTHFQPLFKDIASYLIDNDFNIDIDYLEKTYSTLYFDNNINKFVNYLKERPYKKYYYYRMVKKSLFNEDTNTPEEKIQYIKDYFEIHQLSQKYDISINAPVSFIEIDIIEK